MNGKKTTPTISQTFARSLSELATKKALTIDEAATYTGHKRSYLYKIKNKIGYSKPNGGKLYFDLDRLNAWLLGNPIRPDAEQEQDAATYVAINS